MDADQKLLEEFIANHSRDAARIIEQLNTEQLLPVLEKIPVDLAVILFIEMENYAVINCIELMEIDNSIKIIEKLPVQLNALLLRRMNSTLKELILKKISREISVSLNQLLSYPENSVGAMMDPLVPTLPDDIDLNDALKRIRKTKQPLSNYIYIIRRNNTFAGIVKTEDLIVAGSGKLISIVRPDGPHLLPDTEIQRVLNHTGWIEYTALPVLDRSGVFLGALNQMVIKKIELSKKTKTPNQAVLTGNALGELFRIGLSGILYGAVEKAKEEK